MENSKDFFRVLSELALERQKHEVNYLPAAYWLCWQTHWIGFLKLEPGGSYIITPQLRPVKQKSDRNILNLRRDIDVF